MKQKELNQLLALVLIKLGNKEPTTENMYDVYLNKISLRELADISPEIRESLFSIIDIKDLFNDEMGNSNE